MKFAYVDESGDKSQSDVFVMAGLLIDAYRLRKYTSKFDGMIKGFLARHPSAPRELKTKAFINGSGGWSSVDADDRKVFLKEMCELAVECGKVFVISISFEKFDAEVNTVGASYPFKKSYWVSSAMFLAGFIQKKVQGESNNKGLTVLIFDDNQQGMPKLSDGLYISSEWYDPLYQTQKRVRGSLQWQRINPQNRFDHIINTAFAIKSEHSSLVQVADAVSYVYRRQLELMDEAEAWAGEQDYFDGLVAILNIKREKLGRVPSGDCIDFYNAVKHGRWDL